MVGPTATTPSETPGATSFTTGFLEVQEVKKATPKMIYKIFVFIGSTISVKVKKSQYKTASGFIF